MMKRYAIVIPSAECVVAMQVYERAPEPFEKKYSTLKEEKVRGLGKIKKILLNLKKALDLGRYNYEPIDYDRLIGILDTNNPLLISGCIDIFFDMGIATAEWRKGRRVFRIKAEAFKTIEDMYGRLGEYVALG
jgi:hypothetical protein